MHRPFRLLVWRALAPTEIDTIHVSQAGGFGRTVFDARDAGVPALGYVLEYSALLHALRSSVRDLLVQDEPEARWENAAALLPLVDPARDAVTGSWKLEKGAVVSAASARARIEIPWRTAPEYDLRVTFVRRDGADDVAVVLPWKGASFVWKTPPLENGVPHTAVFRVRNDGITTLLTGPRTESRGTTAAKAQA